MFRAFDPVVIRLSLDATNIQREKIVFELVEPFIPGFSVERMEVETNPTDDEPPLAKRKANDESMVIDEPMSVSSTPEVTSSKSKAKKNKKSKK